MNFKKGQNFSFCRIWIPKEPQRSFDRHMDHKSLHQWQSKWFPKFHVLVIFQHQDSLLVSEWVVHYVRDPQNKSNITIKMDTHKFSWMTHRWTQGPYIGMLSVVQCEGLLFELAANLYGPCSDKDTMGHVEDMNQQLFIRFFR